jgi:hypothetical protein
MDGSDLKQGRTGTRDLGPSNLDLMALIHLELDLIPSVSLGSYGLGLLGARGGGAGRR